MKTRAGFVSNSSSSSFIVPIEFFSAKGVVMVGRTANLNCWDMDIDLDRDIITFATTMDNFDMKEYLFGMGIPYDVMEDL